MISPDTVQSPDEVMEYVTIMYMYQSYSVKLYNKHITVKTKN